MIWHDFMTTALSGHCETFPEPENPVEFIDFNGEYTSDYGSSSCGDVSGTGSSEGSYGCSSYDDSYVEEDSDDGGDNGAYAPGVGQKPVAEALSEADARTGTHARAGTRSDAGTGARAAPRRRHHALDITLTEPYGL